MASLPKQTIDTNPCSPFNTRLSKQNLSPETLFFADKFTKYSKLPSSWRYRVVCIGVRIRCSFGWQKFALITLKLNTLPANFRPLNTSGLNSTGPNSHFLLLRWKFSGQHFRMQRLSVLHAFLPEMNSNSPGVCLMNWRASSVKSAKDMMEFAMVFHKLAEPY